MEKSFIKIKPQEKLHRISETLFGIFIEDISFAIDGGLNVNLVNNHSFDGIYLPVLNEMDIVVRKNRVESHIDRLRFWELEGNVQSKHDSPLHENSWYVQIINSARLKNLGYNGGQEQRNECAMSIMAGKQYEFSAFFRSHDFDGPVRVFIEDAQGNMLTEEGFIEPVGTWTKYTVKINGILGSYGKLVIDAVGKGTLDMDCVSFMDCDYWGGGDLKWSQGKLRKDLVETLKELSPRFVRFPGGCIVEGLAAENEYQWKDTVGAIESRKANYNLWGIRQPDGGYCQSNQVGFYEYFLLCEDLNAESLPVVWAGLNCQFRSLEKLELDSEEYIRQVVQNALDLIEYANGNPKESQWARIRAEAGHPEPFNLKMLAIGNENYGDYYINSFDKVYKAVKEKYPDFLCVMSSGGFRDDENAKAVWDAVRGKYTDVVMDEHFYKSEKWCIDNAGMYDEYDRNSLKVFLGEYAANDIMNPYTHVPNGLYSAIAEAAVLTGVERNSDIVMMSCYAPLLSLSDGNSWNQNLINFNPETVLKTSNFYVQHMFANNMGTHMVVCESHLVEEMFFSASANAGEVIIKLVNAADEERSISLYLDGIQEAKADWDLLTGQTRTDRNTLGFFGEPQCCISPENKKAEVENGVLEISLPGNSFSVIRITY